MNNMRFRSTVYHQTLDDGLGRTFSVSVPYVATDYWIDGEWIETISGPESNKIDVAIEKAYPGWFHRFTPGVFGKHLPDCPACKRDKKIKAKKA